MTAARRAGHEVDRCVVQDLGIVTKERYGVQIAVAGSMDAFDIIILDRNTCSVRIYPVLSGRVDLEILHSHIVRSNGDRPDGMATTVIDLWAGSCSSNRDRKRSSRIQVCLDDIWAGGR